MKSWSLLVNLWLQACLPYCREYEEKRHKVPTTTETEVKSKYWEQLPDAHLSYDDINQR